MYNSEKALKLDNGNYLILDYGKYRSNLTFISKTEELSYEKFVEELNIDDGEYSDIHFLTGKYFVSKKGTKCFEIQDEGPHWLLKVSWGGAFCKTRGYLEELEEDALYFRRASSNGGGTGSTYAVLPVGYKKRIKTSDYEEVDGGVFNSMTFKVKLGKDVVEAMKELYNRPDWERKDTTVHVFLEQAIKEKIKIEYPYISVELSSTY